MRREIEGKRDTQGKSMLSLWMATIKLAIEKEGEFGNPVGHWQLEYPEVTSGVWPYATLHTNNNVKKEKEMLFRKQPITSPDIQYITFPFFLVS